MASYTVVVTLATPPTNNVLVSARSTVVQSTVSAADLGAIQVGLSGVYGPGGTAGNAGVLQLGTTVGAAALAADGTITLTVSTPWGIRADGTPYYDSAGAAAGDAAVLSIDPSTGAPRLTKIAS